MNIILYLLQLIQYLYQQNCWLLNFICRYIPLKQWAFDDSHSPKYQKFKTDELPVIKTFIKQDWQFLLKYYEWKYHKLLKPVQRRNGRTIPDEVSKEFRPFKQMIERLNRTFKASYRVTNGFDSYEGANYSVALWVAYYNFLRPHQYNNYKVLNSVEMLDSADNMPGKWQMLIYLGQQTILHMQQQNCS